MFHVYSRVTDDESLANLEQTIQVNTQMLSFDNIEEAVDTMLVLKERYPFADIHVQSRRD